MLTAFCFWQSDKICNVILKTEQTAIVYEHGDRKGSYDTMKHHTVATEIISK